MLALLSTRTLRNADRKSLENAAYRSGLTAEFVYPSQKASVKSQCGTQSPTGQVLKAYRLSNKSLMNC